MFCHTMNTTMVQSNFWYINQMVFFFLNVMVIIDLWYFKTSIIIVIITVDWLKKLWFKLWLLFSNDVVWLCVGGSCAWWWWDISGSSSSSDESIIFLYLCTIFSNLNKTWISYKLASMMNVYSVYNQMIIWINDFCYHIFD
jgi:hypothetical protein